MSINDQLLIDKYFQGVLTSEGIKLFEEKLSRDPAFREEVEIHQQALQLIDEEGHRMLKERLADKGRSIDQKRLLRKWLGLLAIVMIGLLIFKITEVDQSSKPDATEENLLPSTSRQINPAHPFKTDTIQDGNNNRVENQQKNPGSTTVPKKTIKQNTDELFAAYYTPFEDEGLQSTLRGQGSLSTSDRFIDAYLKGNYAEALSLFEKMDSYDRQNDNMLFIKSLSLIHTGGLSQAITLLEQIIKRDQARYIEDALWYLSLSYIKVGSTEKARNVLLQLNNHEINKYGKKTINLLKLI